MNLTYLYCVVRSARRPRVPARVSPMPGSDGVSVLQAGSGLWLVVSHVPAREYDEAALAHGMRDLDWVAHRAVAHEAVIERFLGAPAVLPFKLFTLFTSDERAVAHVARMRSRLERVFARIEGQREWGVRLAFSPPRRPAQAAAARESGRAYLVRKREQMGSRGADLAEARARANRVYRLLAREATAARRRPDTEQTAGASPLLVDAAFLVPANRTGAFRAALRRTVRDAAAEGLTVSLTGPWPPYHFAGAASGGRRR